MEGLKWNVVERRFFLIDTFAGPVLTQYSRREVEKGRRIHAEKALKAGAYVTDLSRVRANFAQWENVILVQGSVPEILEKTGIGAVAFVHIDMNCALPERAAFEFFWDLLSPGGVILFDDYAYYGHDEQRQSIDEAARAKGADILSLPTGQGLIIR